eukprot:5074808-Prorocentrum_lima.AAC.1
MTSSLVGSEMCIRDSVSTNASHDKFQSILNGCSPHVVWCPFKVRLVIRSCLLYTSALPTICSV